MTILAIETSTRQLGVAAVDAGRVLASYELLADYPHAVELPNAVTRVLQSARTPLNRVEAIVVDIGPGSFTGLRIGLAFVKALVFPKSLPVVGVASLDVLAAHVPYASSPIYAVLDARQGNVYLARYRWDRQRILKDSDYLLGPLEQTLAASAEPAIFVGDGCAAFREQILARVPQAVFAPSDFWLPRAATLARLGQERFRAGQRDDPQTLVPLYLYPMDCSVRSPDRPTAVIPKTVAV
ncbi:MAG: tRNA (adenosine(37)-N6)-threonylcarbamoyltransferase complex dimerization subunit type 1 TsaB [Candidatus Omnitrophica bacterium]|nr:tRNA (adenosine(37)-N6)-threonylcarbamoyltransferase complex dimerization subunit type 1 TsaB [Candidatus Omnitrophota bacterium]